MTERPKTALLAAALFLACLNLRPAVNSIAPLLQSIRNELGMSVAQAGLLTTVPVLCMGVFGPVAARLARLYGMERMIGWALGLIGMATFFRLFADSFGLLLITAFVAGVGIAVAGPLLTGFIKRYFPNRAPAFISVYTVALTIGAALASGLAAPLESSFRSSLGALAVWSVFALAAVPAWWRFVPMNQQGRAEARQTAAQFPWSSMKAWKLTLSSGLMSMIFFSITAWLPMMIQDMGYGKWYAGNSLTLFVAIQIPVSLLMPALLHRYPSRLQWLWIASLMELVGFAMLLFSAEPWLASAFIGVGAGALFPINLLLPIDMTRNAQEAASWSSMVQSAGFVIGAAGPLLIGLLHDATGSFYSSVIGLIVVNVLMQAVQWVVLRTARKEARA